MSRYTGPKVQISRRLGVNILGHQGRDGRALERRPYPPGEHGRTRRRGKSPSTSCSSRRSRRPSTSTA